MKKSRKKLPFILPLLFNKKSLLSNKFMILKNRSSIIPFAYKNKRVKIYNGKFFLSKDLNQNMVGLKLGEFSFTKRSDTQIHKKFKSKKKSGKRKKI
jgi:ribosomal protein S19